MFNLPVQVILSDFVPKRRLIASVSIAEKAEVTTTEDHGYLTGYVVRVIVPPIYEMALYRQTSIIVTGTTTFTTDINTLNQPPFFVPTFNGENPFTAAQVVPMTGTEDNIAR